MPAGDPSGDTAEETMGKMLATLLAIGCGAILLIVGGVGLALGMIF
jgi:hypothetical protein